MLVPEDGIGQLLGLSFLVHPAPCCPWHCHLPLVSSVGQDITHFGDITHLRANLMLNPLLVTSGRVTPSEGLATLSMLDPLLAQAPLTLQDTHLLLQGATLSSSSLQLRGLWSGGHTAGFILLSV